MNWEKCDHIIGFTWNIEGLSLYTESEGLPKKIDPPLIEVIQKFRYCPECGMKL